MTIRTGLKLPKIAWPGPFKLNMELTNTGEIPVTANLKKSSNISQDLNLFKGKLGSEKMKKQKKCLS